VHTEIPDGIDVSARLSFGAGALNYKEAHDGDASDDLSYKFRVEHLPPILLTCLLPPSYPSHRPPFFTMSVEWLDKVMVSSLCHMLDVTWEEQQGVEVIYQWVQWLQSSSLSYLGFDNEIVLSKCDQTCTEDGGDKRACADNAPPDVTIPRIIRYNVDMRREAFLHAIHYCMICFTEFPGNSFFHFHRTVCTGVIVQVCCYVILTAFHVYCPCSQWNNLCEVQFSPQSIHFF
jgi:E3 ubiquitin-protein ligase RNF14